MAFCLALALASPAAADGFKVWVGAELPSSPEGLGFGPDGLLYAALAEAGEIYRVGQDGKAEYIAIVPSREDAGHGLLLGLDFDRDGNIFVAYKDFRSRYMSKDNRSFNRHHIACKDATDVWSGVYRVDAKTREVTPVAVRGDGWAICFPDDVAVDKDGNIYMSDLSFSGIWKIAPDGRQRLTIATPRNAPLRGLASLAWRGGVLCVANFAMGQPSPPNNIICMSGYALPTAGVAAQH